MDSLSKAEVKFNDHICFQAIKAHDIKNSPESKIVGHVNLSRIGYSLTVSLERITEILTLAALMPVSLLAISAAIISSPGLVLKSTKVQNFVNFIFQLIKTEMNIAKEIILNLALPASYNQKIVQAFADQAKKYFVGNEVEADYNKAFTFAEFAAKNGNAEGQFILGKIFLMNEGPVPYNFEQGIKNLELAAAQNHSEANLAMHYLITDNKLTDKEAKVYFDKAIELNHPTALFLEAQEESNDEIAKEKFQKAADLGHPGAGYYLAVLKHKDLSSYEGEEFNQVLDLYSEAMQKNPNSEIFYRASFKKGELLQQAGRLEEAAVIFEQADKPHVYTPAKLALAKIDLQMNKPAEAIEKLTKIENNSIHAKILLANTHYRQNNIAEAVRIYKELVDNNPEIKKEKHAYTTILNLLFTTFYYGKDNSFAPNLEEARKYALLLAETEKNANNLYNAGAMLATGQGGSVDLKKGSEYLEEALRKGNPHAANLLGELKIKNNFISLNGLKGLIYLKAAEKLGHKDAKITFENKYSSLTDRNKFLMLNELFEQNRVNVGIRGLMDFINEQSDSLLPKNT